MSPEVLFSTDGRTWSPTVYSRSPWYDHACHGGPVAALIVHLAERRVAGIRPTFAVTRVTIELPRPVPRQPLTPEVTVVDSGRRTAVTAVELADPSGRVVARGRVTHVRADAALDLPAATPTLEGPRPVPPAPERVPAGEMAWRAGEGTGVAFHSHGVRMAPIEGDLDGRGPCVVWIRPLCALADGTALSPAARAAAVADFVNGVSAVLPHAGWLFINPDLDVHLHRQPAGDWIGLDAASWVEPTGVGMAAGTLFDTRGPVGRCVQSLLVDRR